MRWIKSTVGEYCPFNYGKGLPKIKRISGLVPVYGSNGCVDFHNEPLVKGPGIIIGRKGSVGELHLSKIPFWPIDTSFYIEMPSIEELQFTYYLLKSLGLHQMNSDTAVPGLNRDNAQNLPIHIPELESDRKLIGKWISKFDSKFELNHQTNQTLEQIAQAIFKSWFIDFEPTRAKIAAKEEWETQNPQAPENDPAKITFIERAAICAISGKTEAELDQLDEESVAKLKVTAALFPDALVDSELGEIPQGWEVKTINNYLGSVSKTYPLKTVSEVIFLNTGDIQDGKFLHANKSLASTLPGQAKKSIQKDDILYSEIRPENRRFAFVYFDTPEYVVSTKLMVLRATKDIPSIFLYFILTQQSTIDHLQILAESRSGTFPQITFDALSKIEFIGPANGLLIFRFVETVLIPYFNFKQSIDKQSDYLSELRDVLLPKLLSGEMEPLNAN